MQAIMHVLVLWLVLEYGSREMIQQMTIPIEQRCLRLRRCVSDTLRRAVLAWAGLLHLMLVCIQLAAPSCPGIAVKAVSCVASRSFGVGVGRCASIMTHRVEPRLKEIHSTPYVHRRIHTLRKGEDTLTTLCLMV